MRKIVAVFAAVLALLAPASVAHAAPTYELQVSVYGTAVYPAVDGYLDSIEIHGSINSVSSTIPSRSTVTIAVGGRIIRTLPISGMGYFSVVWDGRAGNGTIVPGTATVILRVDGQTSTPATVPVSAKKLVKITRVTTQSPWISMNCRDDKIDHVTGNAWFTYFERICNPQRDARKVILRLALRGKLSVGPVIYDGSQDKTGPAAIDVSPIPAVTSITSRFAVSGPGPIRFYLCEDSDCAIPTSGALQTFSSTGTYTSTGRAAGGSYPYWRVIVPHGTDVSFSKITIKTVYYVLK